MKIFISYGHDHRELGRRIYLDLHDKGHQVWFDERNDEGGIQPAERWEESIERGLETADWIIALMSPHAMRRPDGVCLDELSYGRFLNRPIVPMMVQMVRPPLCIARLQYIDLQNWQNQETGGIREDWYQQQFGLLEQTLSGERKLGFEGQQSTLRALLQPIDNDSEIARHLKNFTGREWLISEYETWRDTDQQSRIFWITGDPGIGKSAIASILCHRDPSVVGIHFCKFDESDRRNPERAIQSLAYQLATQIPDYQSTLLEMGNREQLAEKDIGSQFSALFEPLAKFPQDKRHVLIIDALDESSDQNGKNSLADTIANNIDKFPSWLGLVITSRPEPELIRRLSRNSLQPKILSASDGRNLGDIESYLRENLKDALPACQYETVIAALLNKCEGSFLYAKEVTNTLLCGELDPDDPESFPTGLTGIYNQFFERRFPDLDKYEEKIRPLIELLVAAIAPLPEETAKNILDWKRREWDDVLLALGSMFPRREGKLHLFHKSLRDWLEDPLRSGDYRVYSEDGHERFVETMWDWYETDPEQLDDYALACLPQHLAAIEESRKLNQVLTDFDFAMRRCKQGHLESALDDYRTANAKPASDLGIWRAFFKSHAHLLSRGTDEWGTERILLQLAVEHADESPVTQAAESWLEEGHCDWLWLRNSARPAQVEIDPCTGIYAGNTSNIWASHTTEDGRLFSINSNNELLCWDVESTRLIGKFHDPNTEIINIYFFNDDYFLLFLKGRDREIHLLNTRNMEVTQTLTWDTGKRVWSLKLDGDYFSYTDDFSIKRWNIPDARLVYSLEGHTDEIYEIIQLRNGNLLTCSKDGTLKQWDRTTGNLIHTMTGHEGPVRYVEESENGELLSLSEDGSVRLWNVKTGQQTQKISGHVDTIARVLDLDDGRIVCAGRDGSIRVFDTGNGTLIKTLRESWRDPVVGLALLPDGSFLGQAIAF